MILGVEIAMLILGFVALRTGKLTLTSTRVVRGAAARALGVLCLMPIPLSYAVGFFIGVVITSAQGSFDPKPYFWSMAGLEGGMAVLCIVLIYAIGWPLTSPERPKPELDPEFDFAPTEAKGLPGVGTAPALEVGSESTDGTPGVCLMLGVLSLGFLFITGIPAILMGIRRLRDIRGGRDHPRGEAASAAGIAFGGIGTLAGVGMVAAGPLIMSILSAAPDQVAAAPRGFLPFPPAPLNKRAVVPPTPVQPAPTAATKSTVGIASSSNPSRPPSPPRDGRPQIIQRVPRGQQDGLDLITTLDTFLAAAVDPPSKTVFIAGSGGPIRILSYPEFDPLGAFQLAGKAFRLALDAPRGLLYAFILRERDPSAKNLHLLLNFGALDRAPGDLHVYDVKSILAEGHPLPAGKLEPLVVIPVDDMVHRLIMAPDRQHLYWLQGRVKDRFSRAKAPKFVEFDVESRTIARTIDLPDGTEAWSLSPHGKSAYAAGSPAENRLGSRSFEAGWVVELDLAAMSAQTPLTIEADPFDIAATDDGHLYLTGRNASENRLVAMVRVPKARSIVASWSGGTGHDFVHLSSDGSQLYFQTTGQSPAELVRWALPRNPTDLPVEQARVGHSLDTNVSINGDFFLTPDGRFLLSGRGSIFRLVP